METDQASDRRVATSSEVDAFMAAVAAIHEPTDQYRLGVQAMNWSLRRARRREGGCLFVGGRSGVGKSWLLDHNLLASDFVSAHDPLVDALPVITVETPSPGNMKAFAARLLSRVLGTPVSDHGSEASLLDRFVRVGVARGLKVVKVEEFQHVVDLFETRSRGRNLGREKVASENLKSIINSAPFQWVIAGEAPVLRFFDEWEQLEGRGRKLPLRPFAWPDDATAYAAFLDGYDRKLAPLLGGLSGLIEMAPRFQLATSGLYGQAVRRILKDAAETAFMAGSRNLDGMLALTYTRWRWCDDADNPFLMGMDAVRQRLGARNPSSDRFEAKGVVPAAVVEASVRGTGKAMSTAPTYGK